MKRVALVLLAFAGCRPIELGPERYPCDAKGNREVGSAQCPGASRCGLEGFCHGVGDITVTWKCESASDCERDWQCGVGLDGVSRECHDPASPEDHRCLTSADCSGGWTCGLDTARLRRCHDPMKPKKWPCDATSDCAGGWQCGLASLNVRECHDPAVPEAWTCVTNDDCLGGWQCGLNDLRTGRECHDPAAPRTFACQMATDCLAGWQCGLASNRLQRECHDPQNPQAFACDTDSDCVGAWRCDIDRLCVNPLNDAVEAIAPLDGGQGVLLSPLDTREISQLSVSPVHRTSGQREVLTMALVRGGTLEFLSRDETTPFQRWTTGFSPTGPIIAVGSRWIRNTSTSQERVETPITYAVAPDGGLIGFELVPDGGTRGVIVYDSSTPQLPAITALRHGLSVIRIDGGSPRGTDLPYVVGFSPRPDRYVVFDGTDDRAVVRAITTDSRFPAIDRAGNRLADMTDLFFDSIGNPFDNLECTYLVDSSGLWVTQSDGEFSPLHTPSFGNAACGRSGLRLERFSLADTHRAVVVAAPWDGGQRQLAVWDFTTALPALNEPRTGTWCVDPATSCSPAAWAVPKVELGPCLACPTGELLDAAPVDVSGQLELEARCGSPDGGPSTFYRLAAVPLSSGVCTTRLARGASSLFSQPQLKPTDQPSTQRVVFSGPRGNLWVGPSAQSSLAIVFDRAPLGVMRTGFAAPLLVGDGVTGSFSPGIGFVGSSRATPTAVAQNEPSWAMKDDLLFSFAAASSLETGRPLAVATRPLPTPQLLVRVANATGPLAVVVAGNQLWTAVVDETSVPLPPPALLVPRVSTVGTISSIAVAGAPDGGAGFIGYATTAFGLSRLVGDATATSWRAEEVPLPPAASTREVWFSRGRARVGLNTGEVLSLPSRVFIAPPLSEPVEDYAQGCGRQLALTRTGLFELEAVPATPMGRWRAVPLPSFPAGLSYADGRLFVNGDELFIASREGDVTRLNLSPCLP